MISRILRRPITVIVAVAAILCGSYLAIKKMPRDIFPPLGVPTIYVAQPYGGMDAAQMESYLTYFYEYHFLYIANLEHVESKTIQGASIMKLQFHPGTDMSAAMAETISYVNRARAFMPAGAPNPFVTRFDAGSVPVGYLTFSTDNPNRMFASATAFPCRTHHTPARASHSRRLRTHLHRHTQTHPRCNRHRRRVSGFRSCRSFRRLGRRRRACTPRRCMGRRRGPHLEARCPCRRRR